MSLPSGTKLAHYEILEPIGKGGMGEVYRAKDSKLGRDVAIKVLPDEFAQDGERLRRFQREAKVLASLNHPNIAAIYGLEESGDTHYLVLELVPGETLADRIARGPIPVEEALGIATKIAEALEEAHEQGIVHRDLKPANIKLTQDDKVKVLDFGLAKAFAEELPEGDAASSMSPTITRDATRIGVILGTAAYMSPEQAKGKRVDKRSDIWAFGALLYEMLTGKKAFLGDDVSEVLAAVIKSEPDWSGLPRRISPTILRLMQRCLRKDPRTRLRDMGDARIELGECDEVDARAAHSKGPSVPWGVAISSLVVASLLGFLLARGVGPSDDAVPNVAQVTHSTIELPSEAALANVALVGLDIPKVAISPDGDLIVYVAETGNGTALFVREVDGYQVSQIPGTEGAIHPFFSPDGSWVGFLTNDQVKKVSLRGDRPFTLGDATTPVRAFWTPDGSILVSSNGGQAVSRISAEGGGDFSHIASLSELFPRAHWTNMTDVSPDGTAALAAVWLRSVSGDYADIHWIDLKTWRTERIALFGYDARFAGEFIVFARGGALMAAPWEEAELRSGEPVPAISGVRMESFFGQSQFSISRSGTLLYVPGSDRAIGRIASLDRRGNAKFLDVPQRAYAAINVSPDDQRLVVNVADSNDYLWIYDLERQEGRRLAAGTVPLWSPKGDEIVFSRADPDHGWRVFTLPVSRPEQPREVLASEFRVHPSSWSPDGSTIALTHEGTANRMSFLNIRGEPNLTMASPGGSYHLFPSFSPDGKWIAYGSGETGRFEIWVRSYPNGETARQISVDGGVEPVWCDNGELLYRVGNQWMVVSITTGPELSWEPPRPIFSSDFIDTPRGTWDVTSDGQRVFIFRRTSEDERTKFRLVTNWFSELKRLVPTN